MRLDRCDDALARFDAAIALDAGHIPALAGSGIALSRLQQPSTALDRFRRALALRSDDPVTWLNIGIVHNQLGRSPEALAAEDQAIQLDPGFAEAWCARSAALRGLDRLAEALESANRAVQLRPGLADAHVQEAIALIDLDRLDDALATLNRAFALDADNAEAWCFLGMAKQKQGESALALQAYDRAIALKPAYAEAWSNKGVLLHEMGDAAISLPCFDRALQIKASKARTWSNRGNALVTLGDLELALGDFDRALALQPDFAEVHYNRAIALQELRRLDEALAAYATALRLRPDYDEARWNEALALLLAGDWARGWTGYETRLRNGSVQVPAFTQPRWDGALSLRDRTILLHAEQGLGDTLQFSRYATLVAARGARVILDAQPPLQSLLAGLDGVAQVVARGSPLPSFDLHAPLLSLPLAFGTTLDTVPARVPYLAANPRGVAEWSARLGPRTRPRIGVAWSGSATHKNDSYRSAPLADMAPLAGLDVELVSLQKEVRPRDAEAARALGIRHFGEELTDFSATAALAANLDLVISVDTSVVHLAGALGREVWVLLPFRGLDWRWLLGRQDSPWYPTARLFRQDRHEAWAGMLHRVARALQERIA